MKFNKMKRAILSLGIILSLVSCASLENEKNSDYKEIVKNNVLDKVIVYKTYDSVLGYTSVYKTIEEYEKGAAHPVTKISSVIYDSQANEVDLSQNILSKDRKVLYEREIQKMVNKNEKGLFFSDVTVNLDDAVVVLTESNIVFVFPHYILGPYSSGLLQFTFLLTK